MKGISKIVILFAAFALLFAIGTSCDENNKTSESENNSLTEDLTDSENGGESESEIVYADGLEYELNSDGNSYTVTGIGTFKGNELNIPKEYNGMAVTNIGYYTFSGCTALTSVTIPDSVTNIGREAFYGCSGLMYVVIGNGVTKIGETAFGRCTALTYITISDSVKEIEDSAFIGCSRLKCVSIGKGVIGIGIGAFYGCSGLTSVNIPDSVKSIGWTVFGGCGRLTSVTIPDSVTSVGNEAFVDCSRLTYIEFKGTKEQWNNIEKGSLWDDNTGNYTIHCCDTILWTSVK